MLSSDDLDNLVFAADDSGTSVMSVMEGTYKYIDVGDDLITQGAMQGMSVIGAGILTAIGLLFVISLLKNHT